MLAQRPVGTLDTYLAALANMVGTGGVLNGCKVRLYKAPFAPTPTTQLADLVAIEADYTGYVSQSVGTWGAPYIDVDSLGHVTAPVLQFQPTDAVNPNIIYGVFVTNTGGTKLIYAAQLVQPVPLNGADFALLYNPDYIYGA